MNRRIALAALLLALPTAAAQADGVDLIVSPVPRHGSLAAATAGISRLRRDPLVRSSELVFGSSERKSLIAMKQIALSQTWKITVRTRKDALALEDWARKQGYEISIEQNSVALGMDAADLPPNAVVRDPLEAQQWGLHNRGEPQKLAIDDLTSVDVQGKAGEDVGIDRAPPEPTDSAEKVVVAVLDTGVDFSHPDLKDRIVRHPKECDALAQYRACLANDTQDRCDAKWIKTDADGNGYPLDCSGWNITGGRDRKTGIWGNNNPTDDTGHGTHVAGIIAGAVNASGIRGVAQNVEILPVKVIKTGPNQPIRPQDDSASPVPLPGEGSLHWTAGFGDLIARGMLYAIRSNAQVVNLSLAWPAGVDSVLMRRMVELARSRGMIVVASAGNDSADARVMPCQYDGVICVASHNPDGALSHFSNFGSFVDIAAPGLDILSSWPLGMRSINFTALDGYEIKNGTSMASPFVAGLAARLLEAGYSAREAYARLMVGARPSAPDPSNKYLRSGNADLARAFAAEPQPLILEATKDVVRASWTGAEAELPVSVSLKNFWAPATGVHVTAALTGVGADGAHLKNADWTFAQWDADAVNAIQASLVIDDPRVDGRLSLELTVTSDQEPAGRKLRIPLEISAPVGPNSAYPGMQALQIVDGGGGPVDPRADLRSVTALDGKSGQDYLALDDGGQQWRLQLLVEQKDSTYRVTAQTQLPAIEGDLLLVDRLDVDQDGTSDYVLIFRLPPQNGRPAPSFEFLYFDQSLKPVAPGVVDYDNGLSVIPERFTWMKATVKGKPLLVPAWISFGGTPDVDKPPFDPWNPNPVDSPELHFYYLMPDGLRIVQTPKDQFYVQTLTPTPEQLAHGIVPILLGKGDDYVMSYSLASVQDAQLGPQQPLALERYRMLLGLNDLTSIYSLNRSLGISGTAISGSSTRGAVRTTLLLQSPSIVVKDSIERPTVMTDSVMRLTGAFLGATRAATFSETHYQIQYNDLVTGEIATTGLDRFSFLPAFIFSRTLFPVMVAPSASPAGADQLPAILVPASLGASDATEVVVPDYDAQGHLAGLSRPAKFRWAADKGCDVMGNPAVDPASGVEQIVFFCGTRFLRLPLSF